MLDKLLPEKGNRNTWLVVVIVVLSVGAWITRGFAVSDWSGFEWLVGEIGLVKAASAFRARGEYAAPVYEERPE